MRGEPNIDTLTSGLRRGSPGDRESVRAVWAALKVNPPDDYIRFMVASDGARGPVGRGADAEYLDLWSTDAISELNLEYKLPGGLFAFGSNGGDGAYAFDTRGGETTIVEVPFISVDDSDIRRIGTTLADLLHYLYSKSISEN
ncbi:MAG: SMI1/KNR4 family protein [Ktedonobacterales bacterium]